MFTSLSATLLTGSAPHHGQNSKRKGILLCFFSQEHWGLWKYCNCEKDGKYCTCYKWIDKFVNIYHGRKSRGFSFSVILLIVACRFVGEKRGFPLISERMMKDDLKKFCGHQIDHLELQSYEMFEITNIESLGIFNRERGVSFTTPHCIK